MGNIIMALIVAIVVLGSCSNNKKDNMENKVTTSTHKTKKKVADYGELATVYLSTEDFKQKVMNYEKHPQEWVFEGSRPAVIDFYATWCGPCKMTAPIIERLARQYKGKIDFYKVDIDQERELAQLFDIQSIPTFLFIPLLGHPTIQMGAMQMADFEEIIKTELLNKKEVSS